MLQVPLGNSQEMLYKQITTTLYMIILDLLFYLHSEAGQVSMKTGQIASNCVTKTAISIFSSHTTVNQLKETPYLPYIYSIVYHVYYIHILYVIYCKHSICTGMSTLCRNYLLFIFLRIWCLVQWILNLYTYCQNSVQFYSMSQNTFDRHLVQVHEAAEL